jgi:hypothetical protein
MGYVLRSVCQRMKVNYCYACKPYFPAVQTVEYHQLCEKSDAETLTEAERERFLTLLKQRDHQNAERFEIVAELARQRGTSVREAMPQLGMRPNEQGDSFGFA